MKKMNILIEAAVVLLLTSILSFSVQADPSIIVSDYEINPAIFMPGDRGIISLSIKNNEATSTTTIVTTSGSTTTTTVETIGVNIQNIWIEADSDDNGKYVKANLNYEDFGYISPGTTFNVDFEIIAEEGISQGWYFPILNIDLEPSSYEDTKFPIPIRVSNSKIDLIATNIPSKISNTGATSIKMKVVNNLDAEIDGVTITPEKIDHVNFIPDSIFVGTLDSQSSEEITFSIVTVKPGIKNLSFNLSYMNGCNSHNKIVDRQIEIIDSLDVSPIIYSIPSKIKVGDKKTVQLKIYNSKSEDISSVIVTPQSDAKITPSQYFIGSMDADDIYSISFDIDTTGLKVNQSYDIGFSVSFKQDGTTFQTPIVMSSFSVINGNGNGSEVAITSGVFLCALIVVGFFIYRWRKKKFVDKLSLKHG